MLEAAEISTVAEIVDYVIRLAPDIAAAGIWWFGFAMIRGNKQRAKAEDNRHTEAMDAERRRADAERARHTEAMTALTELIRRTSPLQAGPAD